MSMPTQPHRSFGAQTRAGRAAPPQFAALLGWLCLCLGVLLWSGCDDSSKSDSSGSHAGADAQSPGGQGGSGGDSGGTEGPQGGSGGGGEGGGSASCLAEVDCPAGSGCDTAQGRCLPRCARDADCGQQASCSAEGLCVPAQRCAHTADCATGQVCDCQGLCVQPTGNPCAGDLSCAVAEYCDGCTGHCRPRAQPCEPCAAANACERRTDVCYPVGPQGVDHCLRGCTGSANCDALGPGYRCEALPTGQQACVPAGGDCRSVAACTADIDCPSLHFCNDRLQCQPACTGNESCPQGLLCQGLRCAPPCAADGDCPTGAVCGAGGQCTAPPGVCLTSADCAEAQTYCDVSTNRCVSGCQRDDDCMDAHLACQAGRCVTRGCTANFQCAFGEVCALEEGRCVAAQGRHCEAGCDPQNSDTSCGSTGQRCLSLQDEEEQPLGDYCFEPCAEEPNECPQGYQCISLENENGSVEARLCVRRCDLDPYR